MEKLRRYVNEESQIVSRKPFLAKTKIQCKDCREILYSKHSGDFNRCKCENYIFIDETHHYTRVGGNLSNIIYFDDNAITEENRLKEMNANICGRLNEFYPDTRFKLTSLSPVTIIYDSLELCQDIEFVGNLLETLNVYFTPEESMQAIFTYDVFDEL